MKDTMTVTLGELNMMHRAPVTARLRTPAPVEPKTWCFAPLRLLAGVVALYGALVTPFVIYVVVVGWLAT